jgi:hypothetical protein
MIASITSNDGVNQYFLSIGKVNDNLLVYLLDTGDLFIEFDCFNGDLTRHNVQ